MSDHDTPVRNLKIRVHWIVQGFPLHTAAALADHGVADLEQLSDVEWAALMLMSGMGEAGIAAIEKLLGRVAGRSSA